jgi:hypothetical protein
VTPVPPQAAGLKFNPARRRRCGTRGTLESVAADGKARVRPGPVPIDAPGHFTHLGLC